MRTVIVDSQILSAVQRCAQRTDYMFNLDLRLPDKSVYLERGSLIHHFMASGYTYRLKSGNRLDFESCFNQAWPSTKVYAATLKSLEDHDINNVFKSLEQYVELYKFEQMEVLLVENPFAIVLYESEEDDLRIVYVGVTDLVTRSGDQLKVYDHKSQSRRSDFLLLDDQFEGYCTAAETNVLYVNVVGLQKSVPVAEKMRRIPLSYPPYVLEKWKKHATYWIKQYMVYTMNNEWPENHQGCDKFNTCEYYNLCTSASAESRAWKIQTDYIVSEKWDPTKTLNHRE